LSARRSDWDATIPTAGWSSRPRRTGINTAELKRLWHRLQSLATDKMPLKVPPPRSSRFGSPLVLNRVHRMRPELIAEVKFLTWTEEICCIRSSAKVCARTSLREVRRPAPHRGRDK
jgi:ATP-dependent DNA ligase